MHRYKRFLFVVVVNFTVQNTINRRQRVDFIIEYKNNYFNKKSSKCLNYNLLSSGVLG